MRMHVDCDNCSVMQHCLTTAQAMFVGVTFVLQHVSDAQRVHTLTAKSDNIILYQIEMPCGRLEVPHWNIDE